MKDKILEHCRREDLLPVGSHVVCAVSGGADSVAMLHCLLALRQTLQITVSAAHFNHCLRGEASDGDEAFVRRLCASWEVPLTVDRGDAAAYASEHGESVEEAARHLRYAFLERQTGLIAVAHNADDQAETVLLNLLRGTGLKGLCAMAPQNGRVVRPLLLVPRSEIEDYLLAWGLPHREDASNAEDDALRNRLRHHVMPLLRAENPNLTQTVGRMTALLRQDETYLEARTAELLNTARRNDGWDCRVLREAPSVLRRRAIRQLLEIPKPAQSHVEAVDALLTDLSGSASTELPGGWLALREYEILRLIHREEPFSWAAVTLRPGEYRQLPGLELEISAEGPIILEKTTDSLSTFALKCDMMSTNLTITVRPRRTGDVLCLPGGRKSLKRLMIDKKIPAARRGRIPVITADNQILAVYGLGTDAAWAARPGDRALIVKIRHRGEKEL